MLHAILNAGIIVSILCFAGILVWIFTFQKQAPTDQNDLANKEQNNKSYAKPQSEDEITHKTTEALPKKRRGTDIEIAGFEKACDATSYELHNAEIKEKFSAFAKNEASQNNDEPELSETNEITTDKYRDSGQFKDIVDDLNENMRRGKNSALDAHYVAKELLSQGKSVGRF